MENITATIPHRLTRDEARRRIQEQVGTLRSQQGGMITTLQENWVGDKMTFTVGAMGQSISGHLTVEDQAVQVEVALPWLLRMLATAVKQKIEDRGRKLLGSSAACPS